MKVVTMETPAGEDKKSSPTLRNFSFGSFLLGEGRVEDKFDKAHTHIHTQTHTHTEERGREREGEQ